MRLRFYKKYGCFCSEKTESLQMFLHRGLLSLSPSKASITALRWDRRWTAAGLFDYDGLSFLGMDATAVMPQLDSLDPAAARHRWVDCVCVGKHRMGYCAEADALRKMPLFSGPLQGADILFTDLSARCLRLAAELRHSGAVTWLADKTGHIARLGAESHEEERPLPEQYMLLVASGTQTLPPAKTEAVLDLSLQRTPLLEEAERQGCRTADGLLLAVYTAARIHAIWRLALYRPEQLQTLYEDAARFAEEHHIFVES